MATTILTAEGATRRTEATAKATYAPLVVLALAQIGTSSDSAAMNLATASLVGTLGATLDDIQMATTLFSLIAGAFMIAGGLIGVTIGLSRALAIGLSLAALGEITAALSPAIFSFTWGGRVVTGLGVCLVTPSVLGLVAALYQGRQRAIAFGTIAGAAALSTLSPLILGIVMDSSGFRLTFAIMAAYFVVVLCCARLIPRTPASGGHTHFDVAGTVVAALGMGLVLFGVAHLSDWGIASPQKLCPFTLCGLPPTLPAIVVGLVLLGLLVPTERRAQRRGNPLIPRAFVTSPSVRAGLSAVALPFFYMGAVGILATPYLTARHRVHGAADRNALAPVGHPHVPSGHLSPQARAAPLIPAHHPRRLYRHRLRVRTHGFGRAAARGDDGPVWRHGARRLRGGRRQLPGQQRRRLRGDARGGRAVRRNPGSRPQHRARPRHRACRTCLLLTMAGGFASQAASAGIDQSYVGPAAETASTLMSDSAFSDEARAWGPTPRRSTSSWT